MIFIQEMVSSLKDSAAETHYPMAVGEDPPSNCKRKARQGSRLAAHMLAAGFDWDPSSCCFESFYFLAVSDEDKGRFFASTKRLLNRKSPRPQCSAKGRSELCFQEMERYMHSKAEK